MILNNLIREVKTPLFNLEQEKCKIFLLLVNQQVALSIADNE